MEIIQQHPLTNSFTLKGKGQAVLMIHGLTSTPHVFRELAQAIYNQFGWTIVAPLLPGHGKTFEHLQKATASDWMEFVENEMNTLAQDFSKVHLVGLSMGGTLCAHLATKFPTQTQSTTLFAPALWIKDRSSRRLLEFVRFLPNFLLSQWIFQKDTSDLIDPYCYTRYSAKAIVEFDRICRKVFRSFHSQSPALIFKPHLDLTIDPHSSDWYLDHVWNEKKLLVDLPQSPHVILYGSDKDLAIQKTKDFLAWVA